MTNRTFARAFKLRSSFKEIGKKLYDLRIKNGFSISDVAQKSGLDSDVIARIEKGKHDIYFPFDIPLSNITRIARVYGMRLNQIITK